MKIENIKIPDLIEKTNNELKSAQNIPLSLRVLMRTVLKLLKVLCNRLSLNSGNSSIPPSRDLNRKKRKDKGLKKNKRNQGGQKGHEGKTLLKVDNPNEVEDIFIDRRTIPPGTYKQAGFETRQVFDINLSVHIKEYRAEILVDKNGHQYVASFPEKVKKATQYGDEVKSESVYMSMFQLIPLARVENYFNDQVGLPISKGSISNFNKEAYNKLIEIGFDEWLKFQLLGSILINADETGINIGGNKFWLHNLSNDKLTYYYPDFKRGQEAMNRMEVLPVYKGILCHDHWKPYFAYKGCLHALCNAHHLRELKRAFEQDGQKWAKSMQKLLLEIKDLTDSHGGLLSIKEIEKFEKKYRSIISEGNKECPLAVKEDDQKGRVKQSKARNLLDRLSDFEKETLLFMKNINVPFTNNQGENDLRMTKVQQKISGCFRNMDGARNFCLVRSYLVTAQKNELSPTNALRILFSNEIPDFMKKK